MFLFWFFCIGCIVVIAIKRSQQMKADPEGFKRKVEAEKAVSKAALKTGLEIGGALIKTYLKK